MRGLNPINERFVAMAEAVRASIVYEVDMEVKPAEFFKLTLQKQYLDQEKLNYNLYKYKI